MSEIKNGGLDRYGAEPVEWQQFETAGAEGVNAVVMREIELYQNYFSLHRR